MDEKGKVALLVGLYMLQGVPLGLVFGTIPYLIKAKASYAALATFGLSAWPYSLKLLWSPIVDIYYFKWLGKRKSWVIPTQFALSGIFLWLSGGVIDELLTADPVDVNTLTKIFFVVVMLAATQDIAVDGWAVSMLSKKNNAYASTAQTIGLNTGFFLSFTVFLALESPEFCNQYLGRESETGLIDISSYVGFWGVTMIVMNVLLLVLVEEKENDNHDDDEDDGNTVKEVEATTVMEVYRQIISIIQTPPMYTLIFLLLLHKIGFSVHDNVTGLKLLDKGFKKEDLALTVLIDFPTQIILGIVVGGMARKDPLHPWHFAQWGRLVMGVVALVLVLNVPTHGPGTTYFWLVVSGNVMSSFMRTIMFVAQGAYFNKIADARIAGTYITLLNTLSNFGGTWPGYFTLKIVDGLTDQACIVGPIGSNADGVTKINSAALDGATNDGAHNVMEGYSCETETHREECISAGGMCHIYRDGYYAAAIAYSCIGLVILAFVVRPSLRFLSRQPHEAFLISSTDFSKQA